MTKRSDGYIQVHVPGHPMANKHGIALEHRVVLHDSGIEVPKGSSHHVHHIDGDPSNNDLSNLELLTAAQHSSIHNPKKSVEHHRERTRQKARRFRSVNSGSAKEHGTISSYTNYRCRCEECKAAVVAYRVAYKTRNA